MAQLRRRAQSERLTPRLYLATPRVGDPATIAGQLDAALGAADVAAVLLRLRDADEPTLIARIKRLAPIVQGRGAALLIERRPEIVARAGADGAHLDGIEALNAAIGGLKPDRIAGCGGLETRHDAMLAGERDADYVMFGEPDSDGFRPDFAAVAERVAWWAELFEPPCVGWAAALEEIGRLAETGADFIAIDDIVWADPGGPAAAIAAAAALLRAPEPVP